MNESILFEYVKNSQWDKFSDAITNDIDINIIDEYGNRLIQYIIIANQTTVLKKILNPSILLDWLDTDGKSVFYIPIKYNFVKIIDIILDFDDKNVGSFLLDIKDLNGNYPIHYCIKFNNYILFSKLLPKCNKSIVDKNHNSLIHIVTKRKHINFIKLVLQSIPNINAKNNINETALHIAATYSFNDAITLFLKLNIDIDIRETIFGFTGLMICVLNGNNLGIDLLIKKSNIKLKDNNGNTAIHLAILENNNHMLYKVIEHKCDFNYNSVNLDGNTCLQLLLDKIIEGNSYDKTLVQNFIDNTVLNIQNNEGRTVWHTIIKHKLYTRFDFTKTKNNIFIKDNYGIMAFDYLSQYNDTTKNELLDIIATSYYEIMSKDRLWSEEWENECKTKKLEKSKCIKKIKESIENKEKSIPMKKSILCIDFPIPEHVNFTTFTGITFDVFTSYLHLIKKHSNLHSSITENFVDNKSVIDNYLRVGISKDLQYEFLNFEVFWLFQQLVLPTNFTNIITTFLQSEKVMFVFPLSIELINGAHANCIIIDKRFKTIERFEPNGKNEPRNFFYNSNLLDDLLNQYLTSHLPNYEYLKPEDTQMDIGFQLLECQETKKKKRIGDPEGFCVLWCLWYTEQRLKYDIHPSKLALKLVIKIKSKNISFKQLIRYYSSVILETRDNILTQLNLDINDIRNNNISKSEFTSLVKTIQLELVGLV